MQYQFSMNESVESVTRKLVALCVKHRRSQKAELKCSDYSSCYAI